MTKFYKISEQELKELIWASTILNDIGMALPTGLEGFEEELDVEDINLDKYEETITLKGDDALTFINALGE